MLLLTTLLLALLQACATAPPVEPEMRPAEPAPEPGPEPAPEPELTLNLSEEGCDCGPPAPTTDRTFLDRGIASLAADEHIEAVQHFQRYGRLEKSELAHWEAGIAIAFVSTLRDSPFYDEAGARSAYRRLRGQRHSDWRVDDRVALLYLALESFNDLHRHMGDLRDVNVTLREDLKKREEAIKRLRELTLGQ
jgi:hypothetical protein